VRGYRSGIAGLAARLTFSSPRQLLRVHLEYPSRSYLPEQVAPPEGFQPWPGHPTIGITSWHVLAYLDAAEPVSPSRRAGK